MPRTVATRLELVALLMIVLGWVLFLASFFLPATNVLTRAGIPPDTPLVGWDAAVASFMVIGTQPLIVLVEPRAILFLFAPLINFLALLSPALALRFPSGSFWMAIVFVPVGVALLTMPNLLVGDVFVGYYLWSISFFVISAGSVAVSLSDTSPTD